MKKSILRATLIMVALILLVAIYAGSSFMLSIPLKAGRSRFNAEEQYESLFRHHPEMQPWVDSLRSIGALHDTIVEMPSGERHCALYVRSPRATGRTAIVVHGHTGSAIGYLYMGRMYHDSLGYNILLPDLHAHGQSEGEIIGMGWNERHDILRWAEVANALFGTDETPSQIILHGVSMGAATVMDTSGEALLPYIKATVADCGYTSMRDQCAFVARRDYGKITHALLPFASMLCKLRYGWSFSEASPLKQVAKSRIPIFFIHGDADNYVPTSMVYELFDAKPEPKQLWVVPGAVHANAYFVAKDEYIRRVRTFLSEYVE